MIVSFFADPQTEEILLGRAELISKIREGDTFILEETDENNTKVYQLEYWKIRWVFLTPFGQSRVHKEKTVWPKRVITNVGLSPSSYNISQENVKTVFIQDKFIEINGISIF